jgi:hypothetical protein
MNARTCCDGPCQCETGSFTRLRYTYGQRLTAVDLHDEQQYHRAKDRFVTRHALGYGILCGLRGVRGGGPPDLTPTLQISRGAAIDPCGNEIVVGTDQCLDVDAWFASRRDELGWDQPGRYPAWVGLRYRECPSGPINLPREPCGCGDGGCGYSRVAETFELALHAVDGPVSPTERPSWLHHLCTSEDAPARCPACECHDWLLVVAVEVDIDEPGPGARLHAIDVSDPIHDHPDRLVLHSTMAIQELVIALAADSDVCRNGPRIAGVEGTAEVVTDNGDEPDDEAEADEYPGEPEPDDYPGEPEPDDYPGEPEPDDEAEADDYPGEPEPDAEPESPRRGRVELNIAIALAVDSEGVPVPLLAPTVSGASISLTQVGDDGWEGIEIEVAYDPTIPAIVVEADDVDLDAVTRLTLSTDPTNPVLDEHLDHLTPDPWSVGLSWVVEDDQLTLVVTH